MKKLNTNLINRIALGDIFRRRAKDCSTITAIKAYPVEKNTPSKSITYKKLNQKINQFVWYMRERGIQQGDKIAILGTNSIEFYIALLGCYKGGFIAVPTNYLQSTEDLSYIFNHAECKGILLDSNLKERLASTLSNTPFKVVHTLLSNDAEDHDCILSQIEHYPDNEIDDITILDEDPAQIMYTSGTTTRPKGVVASHKSLFLSSITVFILSATPSHKTNQYVSLPLFHLTGLTFSLATLHLGCTISIVPSFNTEQALKIFEQDSIHLTVLAPMMWKSIAQSSRLSSYRTSSLLCGFYGMAPMDQKTLNKLNQHFNCHFLMASGQTEIGGACTGQSPYWSTRKQGNYWGGGSTFCDQAIMDDEGNLLSNNEVGEIVWRSPTAMSEYYKNPEATTKACEFSWHHSGDLGFIDDDNQLCFIDRKKDIVKTGGENVSSVLVERTLLSHPDVSNAAVIGIPHGYWGEALVAIVVKGDEKATEISLINHCKQTLGGFQVPKKIIFRADLPSTANGKIKKPLLREEYKDYFNN